MKTALLYVLYVGNLYGTERMAVATARGLAREYDPLVLSPPGRVAAFANDRDIEWAPFRGYLELARRINASLRRHGELAFLATRFEHSLVFWALNVFRRRRVAHYVVVHGGGGKNVYWRNRLLAPLPVRFIAVSDFVRDELVANGVARDRIEVIENFLTRAQLDAIPRRAPFGPGGVRRVVILSRMMPQKRVGLVLDAVEAEPALADVSFDVFGEGEEREALTARARRHPNVRFLGYDREVTSRIRDYDLLLHTAPREPFGVVLIEAMAAGVPVLVPDAGGTACIISDRSTGYRFRADDARDLAAQLLRLKNAGAGELNATVASADRVLHERFTEEAALARYREALNRRA
ncbi:MAG TPA: glycosyltransferase family 4 protein [Usitatibacter sp.]|nr:glycosyltransferase family 4 protein [Usitatibacter sp.]